MAQALVCRMHYADWPHSPEFHRLDRSGISMAQRNTAFDDFVRRLSAEHRRAKESKIEKEKIR